MPSFDQHKAFAVAQVAAAPVPANSGTALVLVAGQGARMPVPPFNASVYPALTIPSPLNAEIVRVIALSGDTITEMLRAQEGTTARHILAGDLFAATITPKTLTDIENATQSFVFSQGTPSDTWTIAHGMSKYPSVAIMDSAGTEVEGDVHYDSVNIVTIRFAAAFSGRATLN